MKTHPASTKSCQMPKFDFTKGALSSIKGKPVLKPGQYHVH